jgi:quinoprotein glucose dehydrogenase
MNGFRNSTRNRSVGLALAGCLLLAPSAADRATIRAQRTAEEGAWLAYAGGPHGGRYSPLSGITRDNVKDLRIAWRWASVDRRLQTADPVLRRTRQQDTPIVANGRLYTVTGLGQVAALDPGTGQTLWVYDPESYKAGRPNNGGFLQRGVAYWTDGRVERILTGTHDAYLISLDAQTGKPDPAFGEAGRVDLTVGIRDAVRSTTISARHPLVAGNVVVVGNSVQDGGSRVPGRRTPPGDVHAFDVRNGKRVWTFHTVPRAGEAGFDSWHNGSAELHGAANAWGGMAYDAELDYVYLATSTPSSDYFGGTRPGDNLFAESLLCLEAKTGKRVWHFQAVHHGLWDYDFPTNPILGDITVGGRRIKAVIQVSKQAFTYVFDRKTGAPVWPIEERPVPKSTVAGEWTSPTQPFPTRPPPFDRQGATEDNLIDFTPELRRQAAAILQQYVHGPLYTPPSEAGTLTLPGSRGGANWGGAAFDPETATLYVPSRTAPSVEKPTGRLADDGVYKATAIEGIPIFKPPFARVTAIDMNGGDVRWTSALGDGPRHHPRLKDLKLPPLGDFLDGESVMVTKTLLFSTVWRRDRITGLPLVTPWDTADRASLRKLLYVFDKASGAQIHVVEMDGYSAAMPMTYLHGGRQYLVVGTGADLDAELVAFALP